MNAEAGINKIIAKLNARLGLNKKEYKDAGGIVQILDKQLRYSRIYNMVITVAFVVVTLFLIAKPTPVITVDASGQPVGQYEWFNADARSEYEVMASAKRFVQHYNSLNANTIFEDAAIALNAMCDELREETQVNWQEKGYLARISNAGAVSRIQFDDERSQLINFEGDQAQLRFMGTLVVGLKNPETSTFDIALEITIVPRTPNNTLGIQVCGIS